MKRSSIVLQLYCALLACVALFAPTTAWADENGAKAGGVDLILNSAWVFNLPGARAIALNGFTIADSGEHKTHIAPSVGAGIWIARIIGAYVDVVAIDGGKAQASSGNVRSSVTDSLVGVYGGVKIQYPNGTVRPYVDFGGGSLHESLSGTFMSGNASARVNLSGNAGSLRFGVVGGLSGANTSLRGVALEAPILVRRNVSNVSAGVDRAALAIEVVGAAGRRWPGRLFTCRPIRCRRNPSPLPASPGVISPDRHPVPHSVLLPIPN